MKNRGFTIVELLIVIVVIGVLSALVLNSFSGAQAKARFSSYMNDIKAIQKAVMNYQGEKGSYPYSGTAGGCWTWTTDTTGGVPGLAPDYMRTVPGPQYTSDGTYYAYCWLANGVDYKLLRLMPGGKTLPAVELNGPMKIDPLRGNRAWAVWSPGCSNC